MRISKLRRTLAVFLSALMITLSVPLTAIRASAKSATYLSEGMTLQVNSDVITYYDRTYTNPKLELYFYWKGQYSSGELSGFYEVVGNDLNVSSEILQSTYSYQGTKSVTTSQVWTVRNKITDSGTCKIYLESDQSQSFDITLDANGGTLPGETTNPVKAENGKLTDEQLATAPTRTGFSFLGWYDSSTGGNKITTSTPFNANTTIFAHWEHTAHDWNYAANGNVITATCSETACKYNATGETLTLNADATFGYTGNAYDKASVIITPNFPMTITNSNIQYEGTGTTSYGPIASAPTNAGTYKASVTFSDNGQTVTAEKSFEITAVAMSGFTANDVTETYDGVTSYGITVTTGTPSDAVIKYGEAADSCTEDESPKYMNAGVYTVYYEVTKDNYTPVTGSATVTINKADYSGTKTAAKEILAGEVNENLTVTLPAIPENMSYGTPTFSTPVTAASVSGGVLTFSTNDSAVDLHDYTITIPVVGGTGANYNDYNITVTLTAKTCAHPNKESAWTSDSTGHWHKCPDCISKRDYAVHTPAEAVKENIVPTTCTVDGSYDEVVYCSVCKYEISRTPKTTDAAGHAWSDDYTHDTQYHWHECGNANCPVTADSDKDGYAAHSFDDGVVIKEPTEDSEGEKKLTCTVCGYEKTVSIPNIAHVHSYTTQNFDRAYHWNECRCGEISDKAYHIYGDWTITELATPEADGTKERSCVVCGYIQTGDVKYIPDDKFHDTGDIENVTDPDTNACHGDTLLTKPEIIGKLGLTPEELTAVENGENISVFLKVVDNTANVSKSDRTLTESVLGSGDKVAMYLDIKLFKQIGSNAPTQVTNTNGSITVVFEIPESLINYDSSIERTYYIIRVHNGVADRIDGVFDAVSRTFSFSTDRFSSYAIAYSETAKENNTSNSGPKPIYNIGSGSGTVSSSHTHVHKLMYDETGHWKQCTCGDKKDFDEHSFGEWEVVQKPADGMDGLEKRTCTVCGYSETAPFEDVAPGAGITAESENADTSGRTVVFISLTAIAVLAAFAVRRKVRK